MKNKTIFLNAWMKYLRRFICDMHTKRARKKICLEIPKLIEFLIAYLNAGSHPLHALERVTQNMTFSKYLRFYIFKLTALYSRGYSFNDAIDIVLKEIACIDSRRYLTLLFMGLKISFMRGVGSVKILQKIRDKALGEIQFQKKFCILTAQMRLQSNVILLSPLCLGGIFLVISPDHILIFFESMFGHCLFFLMCFLNLCAVYFIKKITKIYF